tara:strand:- start:1578 stop:2366 length:789 start_codon:yes stop_codon:yes gene_type:complete
MSEIMKVEDLKFSWGDNLVIDSVDFVLRENEIVSILGKNGAGKSTLLKCLNKILEPDQGKIMIHGEDIREIGLIATSKKMSYVPQSITSNFSMDVFDVILLGRRPYINWSVGELDREIVSKTIEKMRLTDFAFRRFDRLSGGERQRVIIAKAVAQEPNIFLFDEPTSDLDLKNQIEVMKELRKIVSEENGKAALIAIHDINVASRFSDRIILLHEGKIVSNGKPSDVLTPENIELVFEVTSRQVVDEDGILRIFINDEITKD